MDRATADALAVANWTWAEKVARRRAAKLPNLDADEAVGEALVALVQTSRTFDPSVGIQFRTWAARRIDGAVIDAHRRVDPVGRHQRLADKHGVVTRASKLGSIRRDDRDVYDVERGGGIRTSRPPSQEISVEVAEVLARIRALPPDVAHVMERHFFLGEMLRVIAKRLGVTDSRVCQIVAEGRAMLMGEASPQKLREARRHDRIEHQPSEEPS